MNQNYYRHFDALHSVTEIKLQISNLFSAVFVASEGALRGHRRRRNADAELPQSRDVRRRK